LTEYFALANSLKKKGSSGIKKIIFTAILTLCITGSLAADNRIAVVKSRYDNIELVLSNYNIPYDLIEFSDLAKKEVFSKYSSIFFPSGIESNYENNLDISWQGKEITSVKLSKNFFELDENTFASNLRDFIRRGGSAYFSGYAYKQMAIAYNYFEFFYDFPFMGIPGRIEATVNGDLAAFSMKKKAALYMEYPGWIALKHVDNAEVLSESSFLTPRGEKSGPISVLIKDGEGEIIYSSYYSTVYSEFKRFNIYRIAGNTIMNRCMDLAKERSQEVAIRVTDSFLQGETSRSYYFALNEGNNIFYLISDGAPVMYEIYDSNNSLLISKEIYEKSQSYSVKSSKKGYCFIKVYPGNAERFKMHAIISARGADLSPKVIKIGKYILYGIGFLFFVAFIKVAVSRLK